MMRALVVAPADMDAQLLGRDVRDRMVQRLDVELRGLAEGLQVDVVILDVLAHREVGAIDLQHEAGARHRLVFGAHRIRDGVEIGLLARVVVVAEEHRHHAGRGRAHEAALAPARRRARP